MSRYVLTQEQLDRLQEQIQHLVRITELKEERIRNLEVYKVRVSKPETVELIRTIDKLEEEINDLKKINTQLSSEVDAERGNALKIKELEKLLEEERKLTKYSESFAKQVEIKYAEECLIRELTTELCQLQKEEIEIDNKKIMELNRKLSQYNNEISKEKKEKKIIENENIKKIPVLHSEIKTIICELQDRMVDIYHSLGESTLMNEEEEECKKEVEKWLGEIKSTMNEVVDIQHMQNSLNLLKNEIESKRKSIDPSQM